MNKKITDQFNPIDPVLDLITTYTKTWSTLLAFDEGRLVVDLDHEEQALIDFPCNEARDAITFLTRKAEILGACSRAE